MKRILISIILIAVVLLSAFGEMMYVGNKSETYTEKIEDIDEMMLKNDFSEAIKLCDRIEEDWNNTEKHINVFLIHDYIDNISMNITRMKSHIENGNPDMYFAESACAKKALASIKGSEYPELDNIF